METKVDEVVTDFYRLSTWIPGITETGFTFNQFLLMGDEPFPVPLRAAAAVPAGVGGHQPGSAAGEAAVDLLRPREADECGAMNMLLDAAPNAEVIHGPLA